MSKHTPLPWSVRTSGRKNSTNILSGERRIAELCLIGGEESHNAEFICRAANSHYDLIDVLDDVLFDGSVTREVSQPWLHRAREVLARAKGETA